MRTGIFYATYEGINGEDSLTVVEKHRVKAIDKLKGKIEELGVSFDPAKIEIEEVSA